MDRNVTSNVDHAYAYCDNKAYKQKCYKIESELNEIFNLILNRRKYISTISMSYITYKKLDYYNAISRRDGLLSKCCYIRGHIVSIDNHVKDDHIIILTKKSLRGNIVDLKIDFGLGNCNDNITMEFGGNGMCRNDAYFKIDSIDEKDDDYIDSNVGYIDIDNLENSTVDILLDIAKDLDIKGRHKMRKQDIIEEIIKKDNLNR